MRDMKMTDFPTYPWETLDVYQDMPDSGAYSCVCFVM